MSAPAISLRRVCKRYGSIQGMLDAGIFRDSDAEYLEKARFRIYKDEPGWGHLASFLWPPAAMLVVGIAMTRFASVSAALLATALLFVAFAWFILHRRGA